MPAAKKTDSKKADSGSTAKPKKASSLLETQVPTVLAVLLLILGLMAGFALHAWFFPAKTIIASPESTPLEITLLIDSDCKLCKNESSFETLLTQRKISFHTTIVDAKTAAGQALAEQNKIVSFPAVVVPVEEFKNADAALFANLQVSFPIQNNSLVMEERILARQTRVAANFMFAKNPAGTACTVKPDQVTLWEFGDFLAPPVFEADSKIQQLENDLNRQLDFEFKFLFVQSQNAEYPAFAQACAADQGLAREYRRQLLSRYHSLQIPIWILDEEFYLAQNVLHIADINLFKDCVINQKYRGAVSRDNGSDLALAKAYGFTEPRNTVPWFVVDCQYVVQSPDQLPSQVCQQRPELSNCKAR
ncbi:MAG: hypothetical protein V1777_03490 [Candidatus Micrarchaeota archaeon]